MYVLETTLFIPNASDQISLPNPPSTLGSTWMRQMVRPSNKLPGSVIALRLQPSNLQWWLKTYRATPISAGTAVIQGRNRGRAKALNEASSTYASVVAIVKAHLAAGLPGNANIIAGLIRSVLKQQDSGSALSKFTVSLSWTYAFLHTNDFVVRRATTNRKEPSDWEFQWERQILRIAHIVQLYNIPPALVIGFDHTGFQVLPLKSTTWAPSGSSVVPMIGLDDMRQITGVIVEALGDNFEGLVVGMQLVYQGKTDRCLPDPEHREQELFRDFTFTNRVKAKWPWIVLLYIFAGGTGKSQKYDVDGANVMKPKLRDRASLYVETEFSKQLQEGVNVEDIRLDLTLGALKVQQLYWLGEVYNEFKANIPARTSKGWVKTKIPLAFTSEWQQRALAWKAEGKLWPANTVHVVPEGDELEPSPTQDDLDVDAFTDGRELHDELAGEAPDDAVRCVPIFIVPLCTTCA
ncbi:hypothetical protein CYMTET_49245 [Cymbomonas tetramitiformis]|uniref:Uncharacterized protein n=1 Tax=Cymbomonas tetramitiformis TaxID=36881 RepID=A0AAE0EUQ8_9CHLO|nr:hypothetical protein CYMTET_49245 [Cymbomonas tetramitiformis]